MGFYTIVSHIVLLYAVSLIAHIHMYINRRIKLIFIYNAIIHKFIFVTEVDTLLHLRCSSMDYAQSINLIQQKINK